MALGLVCIPGARMVSSVDWAKFLRVEGAGASAEILCGNTELIG